MSFSQMRKAASDTARCGVAVGIDPATVHLQRVTAPDPVHSQRGVGQDMYCRLLTTEEAAHCTGLSQYELRRGAAEGRYPVILLGSPANKFRKMKWRLDLLEEAILNQAKEEQK